MITIALPKGRLGEDTEKLMLKAGVIKNGVPKDSRKLIFNLNDKIKVLLVRAQDVPTYVEKGTADIGVVGKDVLLEHHCDVLELLDLGFGYCKMVVAVSKDIDPKSVLSSDFLQVGTKYANIAKKFFSNISIQAEIIKLYGSVELSAIAGMADCIVDIVSTGATLRENGLVAIEEIFDSTARLICNRASFYHKLNVIEKFVSDIKGALDG
jgi:ATP phosphoribosyltransferase